MAGAELLLGMRAPAASSLYVYARETVGYALVIDGRVHTPATGPGTIANLPVRSELLGGTGRLESTVSDEAVLAAARRHGVIAGDAATAGLTPRGGGRPPGQSSWPAGCSPSGPGCSAKAWRCCATCSTPTIWWSAARRSPSTRRGWRSSRPRSPQRSVLPPRELRVTAFGNRVQEAGAGIVSLGGLYADPLGRAARRPPDRRPALVSVRPRVRIGVVRVAVLSVHTSPLAQPGTGDAGGMNVYVLQSALHMAAPRRRRWRSSPAPRRRRIRRWFEVAPGVLVRNVVAGPFEGLDKYDLPTQLCAFTAGVLRAEANHEPGYYDIVHSHYWLSGQVGWLARDRWAVPLVHTAHTLAAVKNAALADGDAPEPPLRAVGEQQVVDEADRLIVNTEDEARQLVSLHHADPARIDVVHPGVDLQTFTPGRPARGPRRARPGRRRAGGRLRRTHPAAEGARRAAAGARPRLPGRAGGGGRRAVGQRAGRARRR